MNDIACQACTPESREKDGCHRCGGYCGGYGVVLQVCSCHSCGKQYLSRPGCYTSYAGKRVTSFDGLELIQGNGLVCLPCYEKDAL